MFLGLLSAINSCPEFGDGGRDCSEYCCVTSAQTLSDRGDGVYDLKAGPKTETETPGMSCQLVTEASVQVT